VSAQLEDLVPGTVIGGVVPAKDVTSVALSWHGGAAVTLTYRDPDGRVGERLLYRSDEATLQVRGAGSRWGFDADGELFTLVSEARRIRLAHLFDPLLAVHLSLVEPLPHQIRAVYGELLPRQPLRFVLADDPGAGKTIMAGLYIKELLLRSDVARCLVVAPGGLVAQWQDELAEKFGLDFEILTRDAIEASHTGNRSPSVISSSPGWTTCRATTTSRPAWRRPSGTWSSSTKHTACPPTTKATTCARPAATASESCCRRPPATCCCSPPRRMPARMRTSSCS
jgi:hypothetical protein